MYCINSLALHAWSHNNNYLDYHGEHTAGHSVPYSKLANSRPPSSARSLAKATTDKSAPVIHTADGTASARCKMGEDDMTERSNEATENGQETQNPDGIEEDGDDDMADYDFVSLDLQLNELSSALDALEQKNDHIHAELMKLLESNRETRQLFQKNLTEEQKLDPPVEINVIEVLEPGI